MPVGDDEVGPSILVDIEERDAPAEQLIAAQTRMFGDVFEELAVLVLVERRPVAGEIRLGDIQKPVAVVIRDRDAHAGLQVAVGIVGDARCVAALFKGPVVFVAIEEAGGLVAGDIDIGPAVVIEIRDDHAEAIAAAGRQDAGLCRRRR